MSTLHGMPGIGGSLGQCVVCGETFVRELLHSMVSADSDAGKVCVVHIDGIEGDLCLHGKCKELLSEIMGTGWENLPEGPLRRIYKEAVGEPADPGETSDE